VGSRSRRWRSRVTPTRRSSSRSSRRRAEIRTWFALQPCSRVTGHPAQTLEPGSACRSPAPHRATHSRIRFRPVRTEPDSRNHRRTSAPDAARANQVREFRLASGEVRQPEVPRGDGSTRRGARAESPRGSCAHSTLSSGSRGLGTARLCDRPRTTLPLLS
jgi:hypothetical protein